VTPAARRQLPPYFLGGKGKASCDYACGLKEGDNIETVCGELRNMFEYFRTMSTTKSHLRYFDYCGNEFDALGKTGGQQGDPIEMIEFCLSVHHLWGRTLNKHHQDACAVAYADDGYIKAKLSVALEILSDVTDLSLAHLSPVLTPASLWLTATLALVFPSALMPLSTTL
jgi:hypothetical protein